MSLLENHLEQIALSSNAIADLPYVMPLMHSHSFRDANREVLQVSPTTDLHEFVVELPRYHRFDS